MRVNYSLTAARNAAAARAVAARQRELLREARTDQARLKFGDQARADHDIILATRLYMRVAASRPPNPFTAAGRQRLEELVGEANTAWGDAERQLTEAHVSALDEIDPGYDDPVRRAFARLEQVVRDYEYVPTVGSQIKAKLARLRREPAHAAVLNQPEARNLWEIGQQYEADGDACCAFQAYEQAEQLAPAPAANRARWRLADMRLDAELVKQAEVCRQLHWCHEKFPIARRAEEVNRRAAIELYEQIVDRSPGDSQIHEAAAAAIVALRRSE